MERSQRQMPTAGLVPVVEDVLRAFDSLGRVRVHAFDLIDALERQGFGTAPAMRAFDKTVLTNALKWGAKFELYKPDR